MNFYDARMRGVENIGSIVFLVLLIPIFFSYIFINFNPETAINITVTGFVQGAFYALIAVGFSIIFGVAKMFKLSIGGYFVMGAYLAFWFNKVIYTAYNSIDTASGFSFLMLKYIPLVLFFGFSVMIFKILPMKLAIIVNIINIPLFIIHRYLLVLIFGKMNFEATLLAMIIQIGVLLVGFVLYYMELSSKQIALFMSGTALIMLILNAMIIFPSSPAIYISILIFSMVIVAIVAMLVDRYLLEKVRDNQTNVLIITFGIALLIQSVLPLFSYPQNGEFIGFGIDPKNLDGIVPKYESINIFGQPVQSIRIIAAILSILFILLVYLFIQKTPMGRAMEAVSEDPEAAWLVGINVRKVYLISTGLGMGLSAAAGVLTSPISATPSWGPYMGWTPLIFAIAVVTLGGIGSVFGSAIAGFIVGYTEVTIASSNIQLSKIVPLIVIFIIILVRPTGLFGKEEEEE